MIWAVCSADYSLTSSTARRARVSIGVELGPPIGIQKHDFERRVLAVALAPSELAGVAETARAWAGT
jgi:hypothetical protein